MAKLGRFNDAIEDYSKAIKIDNYNVHAIYNRGICFERIRDFTKVNLFQCIFIGDYGFY